MKLKWLTLICAIVICIGFHTCLAERLLLSAGAELPKQTRMTSMSLQGENLFAYNAMGDQLYRVQLADGRVDAFSIWADDTGAHDAVLCVGDELCAIEVDYVDDNGRDSYAGARLSRWSVEGESVVRSEIMPVDLSDFMEDGGFQDVLPDPCRAIWSDGCCYLFIKRNTELYGEIYRFSDSGRAERLDAANCKRIVAVKDGRVLYLSDAGEHTLLQVYDEEKARTSTLMEIPASFSVACFDAEAQTLSYVAESIYQLSSANPDSAELLAAKPFSVCSFIFRSGDKLILGSNEQIALLPCGEADASQILRVSGYVSEETIARFNAENPSAVLQTDIYFNDSQIISSILTQDSDVDVYVLGSQDNQNFVSLRDRGFCPPLTAAAAQNFADALYNEVRAEFLDGEGRICALPDYATTSSGLGVNRRLWAELGFGALPETWDQFFDFLETDWAAFSRDNANVRLLAYPSAEETRSVLFSALKSSYECYRHEADTPTTYSTPLYQRLIERLLAIDFDSFQYIDDGTAPWLFEEGFTSTPTLLQTSLDEGVEFLPLSLDGVHRPRVVLYPSVTFINPYSKNLDLAQKFMGALAEEMDGEWKTVYLRDYDTPVKSEDYDKLVKRYAEEIEAAKAQLENAEPADRPALEQQLQACEQACEKGMRTIAYRVSAEAIQNYRKLIDATGLMIAYQGGVVADKIDDQIASLGEQILHGQINAEQFTAALDRIQVQAEKEGQ